MAGESRQEIHPGLEVEIVQKADQRTGRRTRGIVRDILTSSPRHPHGIKVPRHPHGIKVRLQTGEVERVKEILGTRGCRPGIDSTAKELD